MPQYANARQGVNAAGRDAPPPSGTVPHGRSGVCRALHSGCTCDEAPVAAVGAGGCLTGPEAYRGARVEGEGAVTG